jgi:hypothetical protein
MITAYHHIINHRVRDCTERVVKARPVGSKVACKNDMVSQRNGLSVSFVLDCYCTERQTNIANTAPVHRRTSTLLQDFLTSSSESTSSSSNPNHSSIPTRYTNRSQSQATPSTAQVTTHMSHPPDPTRTPDTRQSRLEPEYQH